MGVADLVEVLAGAAEVSLPHRCARDDVDAPIRYELGPRGRERLSAGETVPVTTRCQRCEGRIFVSLIDPGALARRRAAVRPDPSALRAPRAMVDPRTGAPLTRPRLRVLRGEEEQERAETPRCPACGAVPDDYGLCRCSV